MVVFLRSFLDSPEDGDVWDSIEVTLASVGAATERILGFFNLDLLRSVY